MASVIEKNVLRFQITVNDLETMQTLQGTQQLRSVEARSVDIEALFLLKMMEKLATINKRKNQVQLFW